MLRLLVASLLVLNPQAARCHAIGEAAGRGGDLGEGARVARWPLVINTWPFRDATRAAWDVVSGGAESSAVDAVVAGCSRCEELGCDGSVGAYGSPDERGETTLDALVMDGDTMDVGAVGALRNVAGAIAAAALVLRHTDLTLLVGDQASAFALSLGLPGPTNLSSPSTLSRIATWRSQACQPNYWCHVTPDSRKSCGPYLPSKIKKEESRFGGGGEREKQESRLREGERETQESREGGERETQESKLGGGERERQESRFGEGGERETLESRLGGGGEREKQESRDGGERERQGSRFGEGGGERENQEFRLGGGERGTLSRARPSKGGHKKWGSAKEEKARSGEFSGDGPRVRRDNHDTISMVVIDRKGHIACGTSTNGLTYKIPGRVGDGPIAGASSYVDSDAGGCGATGDGDVMMRFLPCYQVVESLRRGMAPKEAAEDAISRIRAKYPHFVGALFAVNKQGEHAGACNGWTFQYTVKHPGINDVEVFTVAPLMTSTAKSK